jgi:hypothetical protein
MESLLCGGYISWTNGVGIRWLRSYDKKKLVVSILPSSSLIKLTWARAESRCITFEAGVDVSVI